MAYTKSYPAWHDDPVHDTLINAAALNNIENGIATADAGVASEQTARIAADSAEATARAAGDTAERAYADAHINDTLDAHDASAISVVPVGLVSSPDVQGALGQLGAAITGGGMPSTIIDAKGDLIVGASDDTPAKLPVGANGTAPVADSTLTNGLGYKEVVLSDTVAAATARLVASKLLAAHAQPAFRISGDGKIEWGPGGATVPDSNLFRVGGGILRSDSALQLGSYLYAGWEASPGSPGLLINAAGDGDQRLFITNLGEIRFGGGSVTPDVNLYRSLANRLATDDKFDPASFNIPTKAGAPVDADVVGGAQDGDIIVDTTARIPYVRIGGVWTAVGGASGGGVDYKGAWAGGTTYAQGDVVLYNGVQYVAVNPGTGNTPPAAPAVGSLPVMSMVTSLPSTPFDGQEILFTDSLTAPTYSWHLRYVAAKASNKWVCLGGAPLLAAVAATGTTTSTTYAAIAGGPAITVPVAGVYQVMLGTNVNVGGISVASMSYDIGVTGAVDADSISANGNNASDINAGHLYKVQTKTLTAVTLTAKYKTGTGTATFIDRTIGLTPVAVGG